MVLTVLAMVHIHTQTWKELAAFSYFMRFPKIQSALAFV